MQEGHRTRLRAIGWLADALRAQGKTEEARALLDAGVIATAQASLGPKVNTTLMLEAIDARIKCAEGAGPNALRKVLERMNAALGPGNPETRRWQQALAEEEESAS